MERESFMSLEIAELLNSSFVPVKIDREERPDIDAIYMNYIEATTGSGGWPLNVFLTPDLKPVFGGTYFPGLKSPTAATLGGDTIGFAEILQKMRDVWVTQEQKCRDSANEVAKQLRSFAEEGVHSHGEAELDGNYISGNLDIEILKEAYQALARQYDKTNGGLSLAPKFPVPVKLRFLLQISQWSTAVVDIVGQTECAEAADMAITTLKKMARGGIRDHIGYGFARYSVTMDWSLPHFEKMLYDQGLLLDSYVDAFFLTNDPELLSCVHDIATYLTSPPIQRAGGGFFSSENADSAPSRAEPEKREGAFYVWTLKTLKTVLGPRVADIVARFYNVKADGNVSREHDPHDDFLDQNVLSISETPKEIADKLGIPEADIVTILLDARIKLREHRDRERPRPSLDDKIVVGWNGLAISSLARASAALSTIDAQASERWLVAATKAAEFVRSEMWNTGSGVLWRVWREGRGTVRGLADDYAATIQGALELYEATFDETWLQWADQVMAAQIRDFTAPEGAFYTAPNSSVTITSSSTGSGGQDMESDLLLRLKPGMDTVEPSANAVSAVNLFRLASLLGDEKYANLARRTVSAFEAEIEQWPGSFPGLLTAVAWGTVDGRGIWLIGGEDDDGKGAVSEQDTEQDVIESKSATTQISKQESDTKPLTLGTVLFHLRTRANSGRTVLRIREGPSWLKKRNELVGAVKVNRGDEFKVMVCEKGVCRFVKRLDEL